MGAGALHHHVRLDGEVRRRLWGAHRRAMSALNVAINQLEPGSRRKVVLFGLACGAFFTFIIGSFGFRFVLHMYETGQSSNDLEAPMWIVYLAIPLGSYLMCFASSRSRSRSIAPASCPHTDESHVEGIRTDPWRRHGRGRPEASVGSGGWRCAMSTAAVSHSHRSQSRRSSIGRGA